jgi:hypothetical protein
MQYPRPLAMSRNPGGKCLVKPESLHPVHLPVTLHHGGTFGALFRVAEGDR